MFENLNTKALQHEHQCGLLRSYLRLHQHRRLHDSAIIDYNNENDDRNNDLLLPPNRRSCSSLTRSEPTRAIIMLLARMLLAK